MEKAQWKEIGNNKNDIELWEIKLAKILLDKPPPLITALSWVVLD